VDVGSVIQLLGAVGAGSLLTRYLESGQQRRSTRAKALVALVDVESARWAPSTEVDGRPWFTTATRELRTACLVGRVPRQAVTEYLVHARTAYSLSVESWADKEGDDELGAGGIDRLQ
jgi:hypothetical protein